MPERTIAVSAAYYTNTDGNSVLGFQGDKVDVHPDHVKRFDELNVLPERFIEEPKGMDDDLVHGRTEEQLRLGAEEEKPKPRSAQKKSE